MLFTHVFHPLNQWPMTVITRIFSWTRLTRVKTSMPLSLRWWGRPRFMVARKPKIQWAAKCYNNGDVMWEIVWDIIWYNEMIWHIYNQMIWHIYNQAKYWWLCYLSHTISWNIPYLGLSTPKWMSRSPFLSTLIHQRSKKRFELNAQLWYLGITWPGKRTKNYGKSPFF